MKKFYAAGNIHGFANTWDVFAFNSRKDRDNFVEKAMGHFDGNNMWMATAIRKGEIGAFLSKPAPFTGERWVISHMYLPRDLESTPGILGVVVVDHPRSDDLTVY